MVGRDGVSVDTYIHVAREKLATRLTTAARTQSLLWRICMQGDKWWPPRKRGHTERGELQDLGKIFVGREGFMKIENARNGETLSCRRVQPFSFDFWLCPAFCSLARALKFRLCSIFFFFSAPRETFQPSWGSVCLTPGQPYCLQVAVPCRWLGIVRPLAGPCKQPLYSSTTPVFERWCSIAELPLPVLERWFSIVRLPATP